MGERAGLTVHKPPNGYATGIAARSRHRILATAHILVGAAGKRQLWCSGGPGLKETPMYTAVECRECLALLREYEREYGDE